MFEGGEEQKSSKQIRDKVIQRRLRQKNYTVTFPHVLTGLGNKRKILFMPNNTLLTLLWQCIKMESNLCLKVTMLAMNFVNFSSHLNIRISQHFEHNMKGFDGQFILHYFLKQANSVPEH